MDALRPNRRHWRSLRPRRIWVGLLLSPIIPALLAAPLIWMLLHEGAPFTLLRATLLLGIYLPTAELWALVSGAAGVFIVFRRRGIIGRIGCVMLGGVGALTFPLAIFIGGSVLVPPVDFDALGAFLAISLAALPFGLLGGWIFWRIGVRPAPWLEAQTAAVFD